MLSVAVAVVGAAPKPDERPCGASSTLGQFRGGSALRGRLVSSASRLAGHRSVSDTPRYSRSPAGLAKFGRTARWQVGGRHNAAPYRPVLRPIAKRCWTATGWLEPVVSGSFCAGAPTRQDGGCRSNALKIRLNRRAAQMAALDGGTNPIALEIRRGSFQVRVRLGRTVQEPVHSRWRGDCGRGRGHPRLPVLRGPAPDGPAVGRQRDRHARSPGPFDR